MTHITDKYTGLRSGCNINSVVMSSDESSQLKNGLNRGLVTVTFAKANGDLRTMTCTLLQAHIPPSMLPKGTVTPHVNENVMRVFDVNAQGWRSFIKNNVKSWTTEFDNQKEFDL
jgi:hypothetical protein